MNRPQPPYFPPQAEAEQMADEIAAFADRYPLMWAATVADLRAAVEALRWQVRHGYMGGESGPAPNADTERIIAGAIVAAPRHKMTWRDWASGRLVGRWDPYLAAKNVLTALHVYGYEVVPHNEQVEGTRTHPTPGTLP